MTNIVLPLLYMQSMTIYGGDLVCVLACMSRWQMKSSTSIYITTTRCHEDKNKTHTSTDVGNWVSDA